MESYFVDKKSCKHHQVFPGVDMFTSPCEKMMLSLVEMAPHSIIEEHSHPHEQVGYMLEGEADFTIGDEQMSVVAGQMWRIPGGVVHKVVAGSKPVRALDVFHPPRDDYK